MSLILISTAFFSLVLAVAMVYGSPLTMALAGARYLASLTLVCSLLSNNHPSLPPTSWEQVPTFQILRMPLATILTRLVLPGSPLTSLRGHQGLRLPVSLLALRTGGQIVYIFPPMVVHLVSKRTSSESYSFDSLFARGCHCWPTHRLPASQGYLVWF